MDKEEIWQRLKTDPDAFFDELEKRGVELKSLKKLSMPKLFVRERYKERFSEEYFEAAESVLWISYLAEREIRDDILFIETHLGKDAAEVDAMLDEMTFGGKIKFINENYNTKGNSTTYIEFLRTLKNLRNHMAHGRLEELRYGKYSMADPRGQIKLTIDFMNAALKRDNES
jgi:hypothetical protein